MSKEELLQKLNMRIEDMDVSVRLVNSLSAANIRCLREILQHELSDIQSMRNFGRKTTKELVEYLRELGLYFGMPLPGTSVGEVWHDKDAHIKALEQLIERKNDIIGRLQRRALNLKQCACVDVEIGSYANYVEVFCSIPMRAYRKKYAPGCDPEIISVDNCIADELLDLWDKDVITTGCCCGHNKQVPYIGVIEADIVRMIEMGYTVHINEADPSRRDSFIPKCLLDS